MGSPEDSSIDGLLRRNLSRGAARDVCPTPDLLAAYSEHTLEAAEAARFEEHFVECPRCRELLAAIIRLSEAVEVQQEVELIAEQRPVVARAAPAILREPTPAGRAERPPSKGEKAPRRIWWWLAPVAATLLLTIVLYYQHSVATKPALDMSRQLAMSRSEAELDSEKNPSSADRPLPAVPPAPSVASNYEPNKRVATQSSDQKSSRENLPLKGRNTVSLQALKPSAPAGASAGAAAGSANERVTRKSAPPGVHPGRSNGIVSRSGRAAGIAGARPSEKPSAEIAPPLPDSSQAVEVRQEPAQLDQLQQSELQQLQVQGRAQSQEPTLEQTNPKSKPAGVEVTGAAASNPTPISIPTSDKQVIYRIVGAGFVERSADGGRTWQGQLVSETADFTAGSAPSAKICWLVGRTGAIFRTSDGSNWKKIPPPANVDFVAISASDASTATVTASGGQKYSTENTGKIWVAAR